MTITNSDFRAGISITNPSPITKQMQENLPSNYTRRQDSNTFAFLYGTGYEMEGLREVIGQSEANNMLYSPSVQDGEISINGAGRYLIKFDIPYIVPPISVNLSTSAQTDAFIEFTSRYGMTINVTTETTDVISWNASGAVGAATTEWLGDALYNNFGVLYGIPRRGDSIIDDAYVSRYEKVTKLINVDSMTTVVDLSTVISDNHNYRYNPPILNGIQGRLRPTSVVTTPSVSHELIDCNGQIIALISFSGGTFPLVKNEDGSTTTALASSFVADNLAAQYTNLFGIPSAYDVYLSGESRNFKFNRWEQLSYQQEVFRADNKYRRLLAGANKALKSGPNLGGLSTMVEAIFGQPYVPQEIWDSSDFRIFKNVDDSAPDNFVQYTRNEDGVIESLVSHIQKDGYPAVPPIVDVIGIKSQWTPENLTYNTKPILDTPANPDNIISTQVQELNTATSFDITNEVVRQLRVGIDVPTGGIINWNFLPAHTVGGFSYPDARYNTGVIETGTTYPYNYFFLNNSTDSIADLNLFYYQRDIENNSYKSFGPLDYNRDFYAIDVKALYKSDTNGGLGGYDLPAELLVGYAANSNLPALSTFGELVQGNNYIYDGTTSKPSLPTAVFKLDLSNRLGSGQKFPTAIEDFLIYSYAQVNITPGATTGQFKTDTADATLVEYFDARSGTTIQPSDTPFTNSSYQLAQGSFARFTSVAGMEYATTMVGGQITFNKTVTTSALLSSYAQHDVGIGPPGILALQVTSVTASDSIPYRRDGNFFEIQGKILKNASYGPQGQPYYQIDNIDYLIVDSHDKPVAVVTLDSTFDVGQYLNENIVRKFRGNVASMLWDTRIPATDYQNTSPVFQVSNNFDAGMQAFSPNLDVPIDSLPVNRNFIAVLQTLPVGNEQTVTASWTFNIVQQVSTTTTTASAFNGVPTLSFPDLPSQPGIFTYFMGNKLIRDYSVDPDNASYNQTYVSPSLTAYFIDYKDYINTDYGNGVRGGKLGSSGDASSFDSVFHTENTPGDIASVANFFNPVLGLFTMSILPNMEFYDATHNTLVPVVRPRNQGIALRIQGNSYAGLAFYGRTSNGIIDKPARLLVDYNFSAAQTANRHRVVEIENQNFAGWVDGLHPDTVNTGDVFYIAGNEFKYSADGFDQAKNGYVSNSYPVNLNDATLSGQNRYSLDSIPPVYQTDINDLSESASSTTNFNFQTGGIAPASGEAGYPQRYRRPPVIQKDSSGNEYFDPAYINKTPEKISYFKFDFSAFPVDAIIKNATLELYFCSAFTITEAKNKNLTLSYNNLWKKSRLSGNGRMATSFVRNDDGSKTIVSRPQNNVHWRKNFFEILLPYAFEGKTDNISFGIKNFLNPNKSASFGYPPSSLEYLGFLSLDEIAVQPIPLSGGMFSEQTEGLSSVILTKNSDIYQVKGTLASVGDSGIVDVRPYNSSDDSGLPVVNPLVGLDEVSQYHLSSSHRYIMPIQQALVLPNMKMLVFPFGANPDANGRPDQTKPFIYGYVKSVLPSSTITFNDENIAEYQALLSLISPLYAQYNLKLLEIDTYLPYASFGNASTIEGTIQDVSY